jgi:hypothetical protein
MIGCWCCALRAAEGDAEGDLASWARPRLEAGEPNGNGPWGLATEGVAETGPLCRLRAPLPWPSRGSLAPVLPQPRQKRSRRRKPSGRRSPLLLLDKANQLSPQRLELYVFQNNTLAWSFYQAQGFTEVEYGDGSCNEEQDPDVRYVWTGHGGGVRGK